MKIIELKDRVERTVEGIKCECGGYAARVDCTTEERQTHDCGRHYLEHECCARAFVCGLCGARLVGKAAPPEMD